MGVNPFQAVTIVSPGRGNRVAEAPEVIFDLTQGYKVVKTTPPNDSLKPPLVHQ